MGSSPVGFYHNITASGRAKGGFSRIMTALYPLYHKGRRAARFFRGAESSLRLRRCFNFSDSLP